MFTVQGVLKNKVLQRQIPISSFKFFVKDNFIRWMDDKPLFRQGAICDVNLKKNSQSQSCPCLCFCIEQGQKQLRVPWDSASLEEKFAFHGRFNMLLWLSKRCMRLCDVSKMFRGRRPKIYFEI